MMFRMKTLKHCIMMLGNTYAKASQHSVPQVSGMASKTNLKKKNPQPRLATLTLRQVRSLANS